MSTTVNAIADMRRLRPVLVALMGVALQVTHGDRRAGRSDITGRRSARQRVAGSRCALFRWSASLAGRVFIGASL